MDKPVHLLDVNILIALAEKGNPSNQAAVRFLESPDLNFAVCTFTEAGFIRLAMNPSVAARAWTAYESIQFLETLSAIPGYSHWAMDSDWRTLFAPLLRNVQGHNQVTDAYLLGLAVSRGGVLVTTDKKLRATAGAKYLPHLLVLE